MGKDGFGVMVHNLFKGDDELVRAHEKALGKTIATVELSGKNYDGYEELHINFEDGSRLILWDAGQSCCESRYMTCDDNLDVYQGSRFLGAEIRTANNLDSEWSVHEIEFLLVSTSRGVFTVANHNEHNGYYGGFALDARFEEGEDKTQAQT